MRVHSTGLSRQLPGFVVMAAADEAELVHMVATARAIDDRPSAFRYPRGEGIGVPLPKVGEPLPIGKGRILREGSSIALLSLGTRLAECLKAADKLAAYGLSATVADARFAKPLDTNLVRRLAQNHEVLLTVEEGAIGGFGAHVLHFAAWDGLLDRGLKIRTMILPDRFIDQAASGADVRKCWTWTRRALSQPALPRLAARRKPPRRSPDHNRPRHARRHLPGHPWFRGSRAEAQAAIRAGLVLADGQIVSRPAQLLRDEMRIQVPACASLCVARRREARRSAGPFFAFSRGCVCLDVGASTGGFARCFSSAAPGGFTASMWGMGNCIRSFCRPAEWSCWKVWMRANLVRHRFRNPRRP